MPATAGTPRARALSAALRDARETSGVGLRELARRLHLPHTRISHWETGHRVPGVENVAMLLAALRVTPAERERILDIARNTREPSWLTVGPTGIPHQLAGAIECERAATSIVEWTQLAVPGLLQTPDYTRAITESTGLTETDLGLRIMARTDRGEVLRRSDETRFEAFLAEGVLHEPIGTSGIMHAQLDHLVAMANRPNVCIRVIPPRIGWHPGWSGPFVLYEFADAPAVVHFEHYSSGAFIPDEHDVAKYRGAVTKMRTIALGPQESLDCIAQVRDQLEDYR